MGFLLYVGKGFGGRALELRPWQGVEAIDIELYYAQDEREALRLEHQAIHALKPRWNVVYNRPRVQKADKPHPLPAWYREKLKQDGTS